MFVYLSAYVTLGNLGKSWQAKYPRFILMRGNIFQTNMESVKNILSQINRRPKGIYYTSIWTTGTGRVTSSLRYYKWVLQMPNDFLGYLSLLKSNENMVQTWEVIKLVLKRNRTTIWLIGMIGLLAKHLTTREILLFLAGVRVLKNCWLLFSS